MEDNHRYLHMAYVHNSVICIADNRPAMLGRSQKKIGVGTNLVFGGSDRISLHFYTVLGFYSRPSKTFNGGREG